MPVLIIKRMPVDVVKQEDENLYAMTYMSTEIHKT
jgi:hypothetical protein